MEILQPPDWPRPRGYSNGMTAKGKMIFLAGMVGWNEKEEFESENFAGQARQVFQNIATLLNEAGAGPEHIVRMTWFIADKGEYLGSLKEIGDSYKGVIGRHYSPDVRHRGQRFHQ